MGLNKLVVSPAALLTAYVYYLLHISMQWFYLKISTVHMIVLKVC